MEEADKLCEQLSLGLQKQEQCPEQLLAAAQDLENIHVSRNTVQTAGKCAVVGGVFAAMFAGCLPTPLAVLAAAEIDTTGELKEIISKSETLMKEAKEIGDTILTLLNELSAKCASQGRGASAASSDDESDKCEVTTQIMGALARKDGIDVPLDVLRRFNKTTVFNQQKLNRPDVALTWKTGAAALLTLIMDLKSAIERTVQAAGEALLACGLVRNIEEIKNNRSEASRSLRSAAGKMGEETTKLRRMFDAPREIIKKLSEFRMLLKNLGEHSLMMTEAAYEAEQEFMGYIMATCPYSNFTNWAWHNRTDFLNLFRFTRDYLQEHLEEKINLHDPRPLHIVFVAHGSISVDFIPASDLVHPPYITDTILYPPWNCILNEYAAAGIAEGCIEPYHRVFYHKTDPNDTFYDDRLPLYWNSMSASRDSEVPQIMLRPVIPTYPEWAVFEEFRWFEFTQSDRIIVPFLQNTPNSSEIPFHMLIFEALEILMRQRVSATVHLAACLIRRGRDSWMRREWEAQYAYVEDGIVMGVNTEDMMINDTLLGAFRQMFSNWQRN